jgi:hypothetical protein
VLEKLRKTTNWFVGIFATGLAQVTAVLLKFWNNHVLNFLLLGVSAVSISYLSKTISNSTDLSTTNAGIGLLIIWVIIFWRR